MNEAVRNVFHDRWGLWAHPHFLTRDQEGKILAISLGLGTIFNEDIDAERRWMSAPKDGETPLAMILAGKYDQVLAMVNRERGL